MSEEGGAGVAMQDSFGLAVATSCPKCLSAVDSYYEAVLAYRPFSAWSVSMTAVAADPKCPMARVLAADFLFCKGDAAEAKSRLEELASEASSSVADNWTWREHRYVQAWSRWVLEGDPAGCYQALKEVVERHPQDLFAVKRGHIMGLILGDGARILAIVEIAAAQAKADPPPRFLHGMWAFGLEQQGQYLEAEAKAREGLKFEPVLGPDAWLDHGLAHALYFQGEDELDEAIEFLESRSSSWSAEALHPFLYTHCWWHLSLLHCEKRSYAKALEIFDERLWSEKDAEMRSDPQVQLNALNLLWRLDTRGQMEETRPRWKQVLAGCCGVTLPAIADVGASKAPCQHGDLLLDVLLVRGLCVSAASDVKPLESFLESIAAHAEALGKGSGEGASARAEAYLACVRHVAELFRTDQPEAGLPARQSKARKGLRELQDRWGSLGGSEEQRGVLLEAVEGPIVCGAPEVNYTTLFH